MLLSITISMYHEVVKLRNITSDEQTFIDKYKPELTVDNFHSKGIKFEDQLGQKTVVVPAEKKNGYWYMVKAHADIFVLTSEGFLLGWVHKSSLIDAEDSYMMPAGSLNKMPKELKFVQDCPHLAYFGGFATGDGFMRCFGCDKEIVA